ncbi:hypothetical protein MGWOODY_Clf2802 [hydrothermal vent metagenome]|uniref:Uncharacterized protein n=1 Tax=hydrothermal vent metagenome TaxID=652676 RepID=A0A160VBF8_9ZZZZ
MGIVRVDAITPEFVEVVSRASADADNHPSSADVVDEGDLLGEPDGVVQGHLGDGKAYLDLLGPGGDGRGESHRVDVNASAVEVVLRQPDGVEPQLVGQDRFFQRLFDHAEVVVRGFTLWKEEVAELHGISLKSGWLPVKVSGESNAVSR